MWAADIGLADVCLALIDNGADVNIEDIYDNTPLMAAARKGHRDVCIVLLRHILLKQLLTYAEGEDLSTRKMRMRCAIMTLKRTNINKHLITLILKGKPLLHDYIACKYDTYCCRPRLKEYYHAITREQFYYLLGQNNIDALKANMQNACDAYDGDNLVLKNLLNPVNFTSILMSSF